MPMSNNTSKCSFKQYSDFIPNPSIWRLYKEANRERKEVLSNDSNKSWSSISKRKNMYLLISEDLKD